MSIKYEPVKELPKRERPRRSEYEAIIKRFIEDEEIKYARVSKEGVKPRSLASAFRGIIKRKNYSNVKVSIIKGEVYLIKA